LRWSFPWVGIALVVACSEPPPSLDGVGEVVAVPPPPEPLPAPPSIYDPEGLPRESSERIAGLVLPMGLTKVEALSSERRHAYYSEVPYEKLLRYFGPRLITGNVERTGAAVTYLQATPRGVRGGLVQLDVRVEPTAGRPAFVEIFERPPPVRPEAMVSEQEVLRHFRERQRTAE
jgi:hypothetical protein